MALFRKPATEILDDETDATLAMPGVADIIEEREETWPEIILGWARSLLGFLLAAVLLLAVLYTILVSTVLFITHVGNRDVLVARNTYVGGVATKNTEIYTSTKPNEDTFLGRLQTGFLGAPNPSIYKVLSGPYDTIRYTGDKVYVNNNLVGTLPKPVTETTTTKLSKQYLVLCQTGACTKGDNLTVINANQIYGQIKRG